MHRLKGRLALLAALTTASSFALGDKHEHREVSAHEHGRGALNVVADAGELAIELEVPGVNVVGFEHEARTDEQKAAIEQAVEKFRDAAALFVPNAEANCTVHDIEVSLGATEHGHEEGHEHEEHKDGDKHAEHGDEDKHDEHKHDDEHAEHEKAESDGEEHSELHATYGFECEAFDKLESVEVRVFEHLLDTDELFAQVVTATVQTASEISPENTVIKLTD